MDGLIAMACGETARFSEPYDSLMNLAVPPGWHYLSARGMSIAENWNHLAEVFLASDAQWMFLVNDDHAYPQDTLLKLLAHDRPVVTGLYLARQAPFAPVLADHVDEQGNVHPHYLERNRGGLARVRACGDGCLLLKREVLEKIPPPRWELGVRKTDACDHDTAFSAKLIAAGYTIWCDLDVWVGHLAVVPVFPMRDKQGNWSTVLITGGGQALTTSPATSPLAVVR